MRSLTVTLFRGVILGTFLVLLAAGSVLYLSVSAQLVRQMDESLADKARSLALSVEEKHYGLEVDLDEMRTGDMEEAKTPEYLYVGTLEGRIIYRSNTLDGIPIPGSPGPIPEDKFDWYKLPDGRKLRSVLFSIVPKVDDEEEDIETVSRDPGIIVDTMADPGDHVVILFFRDASSHYDFLELFLIMLLATGLGSIGVLSLTVWLAIKKGANPINELAARIESIRDDDLAVRFDEGTVLRELVPIVHKLNLVLDRLEESFSRERGFTSDAAHELRTPLAGLKSTIEVALARKRESGEYRETLGRALEIVNQLESLVKSLLALARLESGQESAKISEVRIENCINDVWRSYSGAASEKGIETSFNFNNGKMASIDSELFTQVLDELFRNALYYVDQGGSVEINLLQDSGDTRLSVSNTGSKIGREEAGRVFDRFWRGTQARDDTGVRFGLGLPIVKKIVETMGMEMDVTSEMGGEFVVTLTMPEG
jgi:signal transduction histidine kinase